MRDAIIVLNAAQKVLLAMGNIEAAEAMQKHIDAQPAPARELSDKDLLKLSKQSWGVE